MGESNARTHCDRFGAPLVGTAWVSTNTTLAGLACLERFFTGDVDVCSAGFRTNFLGYLPLMRDAFLAGRGSLDPSRKYPHFFLHVVALLLTCV